MRQGSTARHPPTPSRQHAEIHQTAARQPSETLFNRQSVLEYDSTGVAGWVVITSIIIPLRGSIFQVETCQILRLAENPRWSPSVATKTLSAIRCLDWRVNHQIGKSSKSSWSVCSRLINLFFIHLLCIFLPFQKLAIPPISQWTNLSC